MPLHNQQNIVYPMTDFQQQQPAAVASMATAAPSEPMHQQVAAPDFAFNDEPVFSIDDETLLSGPSAMSGLNSVVGSADDFFSSPEWTDPSPALTTSMSFNLDSCDTSPLLTDVNEAPEMAGMPLFGDQAHFSLFQQQAEDVGANAPAGKRSPQMAFSRVKETNEQSAMLLLRAFNNSAISNAPGVEAVKATELSGTTTASPAAILSPLPLASLAPPTPAIGDSDREVSRHGETCARGTKRRIELTDLLPIDAPIQPRSYKTPSATSRKSSSSTADEAPATPDMSNMDPSAAKRLSNTLAARRSRHRKAEELKQLNDTIEDLTAQVEMWKRRCMRAEQERDQALSGHL